MDFIPEDRYFKYNGNTLVSLRKCYNLDKPGQMDEVIDLLNEWVKKQAHFENKDFPKEYLERIIISLKGSQEKAKGQLEKICTFRTLLPHFFEKLDAKQDFKAVKMYHLSILLPRLTEDNQRICLLKMMPIEYSQKIYFEIYCYSILILEYMKTHDYNGGVISLVDVRGVNILDFVTRMNLNELQQMVTIALQGYSTRAKKFVLISTSKSIDLLVKILRQLLPDKLGKRIFVVQDLDGLHKHVPKHLLPKDYGGEEKTLEELHGDLQEAMASKQHMDHLKWISQARTKESLRIETMSNDISGVAGSFRTLSFD